MGDKKEAPIRVSKEARAIAKKTCKRLGMEMTPGISRALIRAAKEKPEFFCPQTQAVETYDCGGAADCGLHRGNEARNEASDKQGKEDS